jgi:AcrR family transcriptional regulator
VAVATGPKRGRPATARRDEVLQAARGQYLAGNRVDLTVIARRLGLGRATIYRWFGSRELVLGEVIADELERLIAAQRRAVRRRGVEGLLEVFDRINRALADSAPLRRFLEQERAAAMRLLTCRSGVVQPRAVRCVTALIAAEVAAARYEAPAEPEVLAYASVRLAEAFLYNDAAFGIRGDHARLAEVQAALFRVASARTPPWIPEGQTIIAPIRMTP